MKTKTITQTALFTAIMIICSQITIPTGLVPFSMSIFAIYLTGLTLERNQAVIAIVVYILLGIVGLPVFAGFGSGIGKIMGPTGGFIIAYPIMAFIVSAVAKNGKLISHITALALSTIVCYVLGTLWYAYVLGVEIQTALLTVALPYIPFDILKYLVAYVVAKSVKKVLKYSAEAK